MAYEVAKGLLWLLAVGGLVLSVAGCVPPSEQPQTAEFAIIHARDTQARQRVRTALQATQTRLSPTRVRWRYPDGGQPARAWRIDERGGPCSGNPPDFKWRAYEAIGLPVNTYGWKQAPLTPACSEVRLCVGYDEAVCGRWIKRP